VKGSLCLAWGGGVFTSKRSCGCRLETDLSHQQTATTGSFQPSCFVDVVPEATANRSQ
jgi:hypothetical protein